MKAKGKSNRDNQAKGWGVPSRRITVICACLLAWNILFPVSWFLEAEAIAVNRASAKYQHVASTDNEEYRRLMHEEMDLPTKEEATTFTPSQYWPA